MIPTSRIISEALSTTSFGNTGRAAALLEVSPGQLARQIELSPTLKADRDVARRMIVDLAEERIVEALLDDTSTERRDETARFVLTSLGRGLGWSTSASAPAAAGFSLSDGSGRTLSVKWQTDDN